MKIFNWTKNIPKDELNEVIRILDKDGIVIFPTETVYGIGVNAKSKKAINKLYEAKLRPKNKPFSVLVKDKKMINSLAEVSNNIEKSIIKKFMPGEITLILNKRKCISNLLTANKKTIGIRIPNNNIALTILKKSKIPLATSSANLSGKEILNDVNSLKKVFENKVDIIIVSNSKFGLLPSTIVEVKDGKINIIREGSITLEQIKKKILMK